MMTRDAGTTAYKRATFFARFPDLSSGATVPGYEVSLAKASHPEQHTPKTKENQPHKCVSSLLSCRL